MGEERWLPLGMIFAALLWIPNRDSVELSFICALLALASLLAFIRALLRSKRWCIRIYSQEVVYINIYGRARKFQRLNVRWRIETTFYWRQVHIRLYDYTTGKLIVSVPCDWKNVKALLELYHFGSKLTEYERGIASLLRNA